MSIALKELRDAVIFFNRQGQGVKIEGLGIYTPKIAIDGQFGVGHRADTALKNAINAPGSFNGDIENRANIGKTAGELVALWNEEHPDDPVV